MIRLTWLAAILTLAGSAFAQTTHLVPSQFPTIQAAINAAATGDTVLVSPGVYVENLIINSKAIALESAGGPTVTTIDGGMAGTVVQIGSVQDYSAGLSGFTIENGLGLSTSLGDPDPGGIRLSHASVTIRNCRIRNCIGGDALTPPGFPGSAPGQAGAGGVGMFQSFPRFENCEITGNQGGLGTITLAQIFPTLPPQVVVSRPGTGGIHARRVFFSAQPLGFELSLKRCLIVGNSGGDGAGGVFTPQEQGGVGAIDLEVDSFCVEECLIAGNVGGQGVGVAPARTLEGGCVRLNALSEGLVDRVTITGNVDSGNQTTVALMNFTELRNSIVRSNLGSVVEVDLVFGFSSVNHCNVGGGIAGAGNVDLPSGFVDPMNGDFTLDPSSPLRDRGDGADISLPAVDLAGGFRWVGAAPEMGCYELDDLDGSAEDFQLRTVVNGGADEDFPTKLVTGGDVVEVSFGSDGGTFASAVPALFVQVFTNGTQPSSPLGFPELEINDQGGTLVLFDGNLFGPAILGPTPYVFTYAMPIASGITARFQAACFSAAAANGIFATTRAHDLIFP